MKRTTNLATGLASIATLTLALALVTGCGQEPAPTGPEGEEQTLAQLPAGLAVLTFSPTDGPAAKVLGTEGSWDYATDELIGPRGGKLRIRARGESGEFLKVVLRIPRRAVADETLITMAVVEPQ